VNGRRGMLTLTIMNNENQIKKDIQVNEQQRIEDTLRVLEEAAIISNASREIKVKSVRRGTCLDIKASYEDEHINNGDILELI